MVCNTLITTNSQNGKKERKQVNDILNKDLTCQLVIEVQNFSLCSDMSEYKLGFMRYLVKHLDYSEARENLKFDYLD